MNHGYFDPYFRNEIASFRGDFVDSTHPVDSTQVLRLLFIFQSSCCWSIICCCYCFGLFYSLFWRCFVWINTFWSAIIKCFC